MTPSKAPTTLSCTDALKASSDAEKERCHREGCPGIRAEVVDLQPDPSGFEQEPSKSVKPDADPLRLSRYVHRCKFRR